MINKTKQNKQTNENDKRNGYVHMSSDISCSEPKSDYGKATGWRESNSLICVHACVCRYKILFIYFIFCVAVFREFQALRI